MRWPAMAPPSPAFSAPSTGVWPCATTLVQEPGPYLWGVMPSLLAWLALLLPPTWGLLTLAVLLGLCLLVDERRFPHYQLQAWLPLRRRLTLVASLACVAGAAGLLR